MKLTVLGCWAPYPRAAGACSGYLLQDAGLNILLEAGNGSLSRLMNIIDFRSLDAVIVTHLHHDHYSDLFVLRYAIEGARRDGSRGEPLKLFLPGEPAVDYNLLAGYNKAFITKPIESLPREPHDEGFEVYSLTIGGLSFRFAPIKHPLPGYSVAAGEPGGLVFSSDTTRTRAIEYLAQNAGLFLCEASGLDSDAEAMRDIHLTAGQAGELARDAGVKRLLLTHFWPEYDPALLGRQAEQAFKKTVELAREGETYLV
ncbi:MBL fold metallo-hydrolase [Pelotomaculum propionicicum]|uniref:MBL fold metallo-hydrolase n=1 Tax=Pelotomaculum propionicicum TaxID=258475 RepID=UPI003B7621B5